VGSVTFDLERYLVPKALVLHATALGLLLLGFPSLRAPRWGYAEWLLVAFVGVGALSAALAENRWLALSGWGIGLSSLVLLLAAREVAERYRWGVLSGLVTAAVLGAGLGIAQAYGVDWDWLADTRPPGGTFGNRNFLAHLSVLAAPPLLVLAARVRRQRWLPALLLALAVLAAAVVLTRSRAAWLGGLGGISTVTLALMLSRQGGRPTFGRSTAVIVVFGLAVGAAVLLPNRLRWTTDAPYAQTLARLAAYGEGSGRGRLIQYRNSLEIARDDPVLGVGAGNWFVHYPRVTTSGDPAFSGHLSIPTNPWPSSDWVAFIVERGVLGTLLLLAAGVTAAGRGLGAARNGFREEARAGAAAVGVLVTALIAGSFDAVLLLAAPSYLVWASVGLLLPEPRRPIAWVPRDAPRRLLRTTAVLLALVLVADTASRGAAIRMTRDSVDRETLVRAARVSPGEHRFQLLLAEGGDCDAARRAAVLMPHHENVERLARRCG
jgi:O-antigen ligase